MTGSRSSTDIPARLLVVEDDPAVVRTILDGLDPTEFSVDHCPTLAAGYRALSGQKYDVLILDLGLPDGSGLKLADRLRGAGSELPIIVLTARTGVDERVNGFEHGADDYLCKPFSVAELSARIQALLRRSRPAHRHILTYREVELDLLKRVVKRGERQASLSAREVDLLAYLILHAEETIPRERILEDVWGEEGEDDTNVLNVYVNYLRNKLEGGRLPRLIHTIRGIGYLLSESDPDQKP
jgi:two-component system response regulator MprA